MNKHKQNEIINSIITLAFISYWIWFLVIAILGDGNVLLQFNEYGEMWPEFIGFIALFILYLKYLIDVIKK